MKLLIVAEGASELEGALRALVQRLLPIPLDIEQDRVSRTNLRVHHGKGRGYFKRAARWMIDAEKRGYDALIVVIDEDGRPESAKELNEAQQDPKRIIRRAFGVAIRTFDAWMLSDEVALTAALASKADRQPDPETIRDPKELFRSLHEKSPTRGTIVEAYAAVAQTIDLDVLEKRCPKGFGIFAERVRGLPRT